MAWIEGRNQFPGLRNSLRFSLIAPDGRPPREARVLWLLPVAGGLYSDWVRFTRVEELAGEEGLWVVMPEGLHSDFADMVSGMRWWQFLSEEFPDYLQAVFGIEKQGAGQLAFGAGMGGLGALKMGLRLAERMAAVGAVHADLGKFDRCAALADRRMEDIYGPAPIAEEILAMSDPLRMARGMAGSAGVRYCLDAADAHADALASLLAERACPVERLKTRAACWSGYEAALAEFLHINLH